MKLLFLRKIMLLEEMENPQLVIDKISDESVFHGTNLWVLVFAIFIASLGLNINSTAVIIGAMLISPLMGPIMGMGLGLGINDLDLFKKAAKHYSFAVIAALITSFLYFSITPLNDAYSELLARTSPTIYDVLIAIFGGLAGIVANTSKTKGNVIPGVAIATALMPPLCTAGYGLALMNFQYFFGAIFLFTINTVFIALATFFTSKVLKFPIKHLSDKKTERYTKKFITILIILTLLPSIYFGYEMVQQNKFLQNANRFVEANSSFEGNYLLDKKIGVQSKSITLVYGGKSISQDQIEQLKEKLSAFGLKNAVLTIKQGFSIINNSAEFDRTSKLSLLLSKKDREIFFLKNIVDSISASKRKKEQIFEEMKILYPETKQITIDKKTDMSDSVYTKRDIIIIQTSGLISENKKKVMKQWLKKRLDSGNVQFLFAGEFEKD